jgi:glycosyltransferase involved in cell wall biosynthesis
VACADSRDALTVRILHIGKYYPPVAGGVERFLADLVAAQRAAGHEVRVLVHEHDGARPASDPPWLKRCPVWLRLIFAPISPRFPFWLRGMVLDFRPDVIHMHMPNVSPFWALLIPSVRRIPWIVHWHADVERRTPKLAIRLAYPHYRIFERALLEHAETIIATSKEYLESSKPLEPWRFKCHVVPLGVDPARLPALTERDTQGLWPEAGLRVLAVGRLSYYKSFDTLVRAALGEPNVELVIAGEGEERPRLERILRDAGDPAHVRLLGEVDDATLCRLMASCHVLALPSFERTEAFGLVLVEAMRYARPLLVGNVPGSGMHFLARSGQNAVTVEPRNVAAWKEALRSMAADATRRQLMGRLGFERYRRELDIARIEPQIASLYAFTLQMRKQDKEFVGNTPAAEPEDRVGAPRQPRLLVVIPALDEGENIGAIVSQVRALGSYDVLVVDDGSTDDTAAIAIVNGATVVRAPLWQGAWGAMQTGLRYALRRGYSGVITMDGDGQHEPLYLPQLLDAARDADVVIAACPGRGSRLRQIAWAYFRAITGFRFEDLTSGFRYYNERACRLLAGEEATLLDYQDVGVLLLLRHANLRIAEISVAMNPRRSGGSRVFSSWWTVARYMAETSLLCLARWNQRSRKP